MPRNEIAKIYTRGRPDAVTGYPSAHQRRTEPARAAPSQASTEVSADAMIHDMNRAFAGVAFGIGRLAARAKRETRANGGSTTAGDFLRALAQNAIPQCKSDPRLEHVRAPTGTGEVDPSGGGFLVPPTFLFDDFIAPLYEASVIAQFCDRRKVTTPLADVRIPAVDQSSRADGSRWGNVVSAWANEADNYTGTAFGFAKTRLLAFGPKKLHMAAVVSAELVQDAPLLESVITRAFQSEMAFKLDLSILKGTGAGQPQGVLNAGALITVAKDAGQAPKTITPSNIDNMWSRLPAESGRNAFWLISEDVEPQLAAMAQVVGSAGAVAPASAMLYPPWAGVPTIKGRPAIVFEGSPTLGQVGDIVLCDPSAYIVIENEAVPAVSIHAKFVSDEIVFRIIYRVDGQPAYSSAITPFNGSGITKSPYVTLASR